MKCISRDNFPTTKKDFQSGLMASGLRSLCPWLPSKKLKEKSCVIQSFFEAASSLSIQEDYLKMKRILVGAPLLGTKTEIDESSPLEAWRTFAPLITDPQESKSERFVLLPNPRFISVLAYKTGKRIATILPSLDTEHVPVEITAVTLGSTQQTVNVKDLVASEAAGDHQILVLACNDGSLRTLSLDVLRNKGAKMQNCGPYWIPGDCYRPQQVFLLNKKEGVVHHMQFGYCRKDHVAVYAIAKGDIVMSAYRFMLQLKLGKNKKKKLDSSSIICLESNVSRFSEENPENPFGLSVCNYEKDGNDANLDGPYCSVVVIGFSSSLLIFMEKTTDSGTTMVAPFVWNLSSSNKITTLAIAPNKRDIACGHMRGSIQVLVDLIPRVEEYNDNMARYEAQLANESLINDKKPRHPSKGIVVRKFHWHAHPVSTLVFDSIPKSAGDSMLYSGAEESVIVTWQLSRGSDKPAEVLPRIALAGIVHMVSSHQSGEADSLLVYCADNSLHLFETHNQHLKWKVQGLGAGDKRNILSGSPKMILDPTSMGFSSPKILCAGLAKAAGNIQTYDVRQQEVIATLQVAPFNRVSRMKYSQSQLPAPTIIHAEWDAIAKRLLTIDTVPTENSAIGVIEQLEDGTMIGTVSTIRFWKFNENSLAFDPCAAMASPHGPRAKVSSAALSADGKYACTVSNDEKAFRLWRRSTKEEGDDWNCTYRIQFPSGYANASSGPSAVSFSNDSSVLAIGFGNLVTLWDRHNVTLLTSLRHDEGDDIVETVHFVKSGELEGMLLSQSSSSIALQSPYANKGISSKDWFWRSPSGEWSIRSIIPLAGLVSVILIDLTNNKSRVVLLDLKTGLQLEEQVNMIYDDEIVGLVGGASQRLSDEWDDGDVSRTVLYTLFKNGEITCINMDSNEGVDIKYIPPSSAKAPAKMVPTLGLHLVGIKAAKRPANVLTITDLNGSSKRKKLSIENFGAFVGEEARVAVLPKLTGTFVRAFVSRNVMKSEQ